MSLRWRPLALLVLLLGPFAAPAHEVRPAYLELREVVPGEFAVLWKTPMRGDLRLALSPDLSGRTEQLTPTATRESGDAAVQTWRIKTMVPLRGQTLHIRGIEATMTDALARIEFVDGSSWLHRLTPQVPAATIPERQSGWSVAWEYLRLGVGHILGGIDHLLLVLALLLIARGARPLVKTVTAFTVAHSMTLALAALGFVRVPQAPVEAVISLSIVLVAVEIVRARTGYEGIAARAPWSVALSFGLLHGFGFAGALVEIGLPEHHIPLALLFFNMGVELGQLLFIAAVLVSMGQLRRVPVRLPPWATWVPPYAIGSVAMFWTLQRIAAF